jgi:hypothetical protein
MAEPLPRFYTTKIDAAKSASEIGELENGVKRFHESSSKSGRTEAGF